MRRSVPPLRRFVPVTAFAVFVLLAGCHRATVGWQPSLVSQVPDSTPVRFFHEERARLIDGRALDWQRRAPKLVTTSGDTLVVPEGAKVSVRLEGKARHAGAGALVGAVVGVGVMYATCPEPKKYCGEQNPTGMLFAGLGALVGAMIKTDNWIRVGWDSHQ
jgi:hypothetical protein